MSAPTEAALRRAGGSEGGEAVENASDLGPVGALALSSSLTLCSTFALLSSSWSEPLVLVPGKLLEHPWTLLTAHFVELDVIKLFVVGLCVAYCGLLVEGRVGASRLWLLVLATCVCSSVVAVFVSLWGYVERSSVLELYGGVFGSGGLALAVSVAAVQSGSDERVDPRRVMEEQRGVADVVDSSEGGGGRAVLARVLAMARDVLEPTGFRHRHLCLALLTFFLCWDLLRGSWSSDIVFLFPSLLFAWAYLRYWEPHGDGTYGDGRAEFAFHFLWPRPFRPAARIVGSLTGSLCLRAPCFQLQRPHHLEETDQSQPTHPHHSTHTSSSDHSSTSSSSSSSSLPSVDAVAERRRAKAQAALDKRLAEIDARRGRREQQVREAHRLSSPAPSAPTSKPTPTTLPPAP